MTTTTTATNDKRLRTVAEASKETGLSKDFFWRLLREGKLTVYKVQSVTCLSMVEFESTAIQIRKTK